MLQPASLHNRRRPASCRPQSSHLGLAAAGADGGADAELYIGVLLQPLQQHGAHRRRRREDAAFRTSRLLAVLQLQRGDQ